VTIVIGLGMVARGEDTYRHTESYEWQQIQRHTARIYEAENKKSDQVIAHLERT